MLVMLALALAVAHILMGVVRHAVSQPRIRIFSFLRPGPAADRSTPPHFAGSPCFYAAVTYRSAALGAPAAGGWSAPPTPRRAAEASLSSGLPLGPLWRDDKHGFMIRPPPGCQALGASGDDLASFANQARRWGIIVHRSRLDKPTPLAQLVPAILAQARHEFKKVVVLQDLPVRVGAYPGVKLVLRFQAISNHAPLTLLRQQLLVQAKLNEYYTVTFFSPASQAATVRPLFDAVSRAFRLLNPAVIQRERLAAIQSGKHWLQRLTVQRLLARLKARPQLFRVRLYHHDIGYLRLHAFGGKLDGYQGVIVNTNSRMFLAHGETLMAKVQSFWARRHQPGQSGPPVQYSSWYSAVARLTPIRDPRIIAERQEQLKFDPATKKFHLVHIHIPWPTMFVHWNTELGIQQGGNFPVPGPHGRLRRDIQYQYRIRVLRGYDHVQAGQSQHPLRFSIPRSMPAVLPPALKYLWPRLVNVRRKQMLAFVAFDSSRSRLALFIMRVLGAQTIMLRGRPVRAYHLENQLYPGVTELWVNAAGRLLKVQASDGSVWLPTSAQAMNQLWAARLAALHG